MPSDTLFRKMRPFARPTSMRRSVPPTNARSAPIGIVTVEAEVAREVVASSERNADERGIAFERHLGDRRQRAVASGHAQDLGRRGAGQLRRVLAFPQDVRLDAGGPRLDGELVGRGRAFAGTRIDEQEGGQRGPR